MKLIEQSHEIVESKTPAKHIEAAGRTCYKSEDKITDDSAKKFIRKILKSGHLSVIEHATTGFAVMDNDIMAIAGKEKFLECGGGIVSGNYRAWLEAMERSVELSIAFQPYLQKECPVIFGPGLCLAPSSDISPLSDRENEMLPIEIRAAHTYATVRFVTNRGVTHELVRHRVCAFSQESTRFVRYDGEMEFILPAWSHLTLDQFNAGTPGAARLNIGNDAERIFAAACEYAEEHYQMLLREGWAPQQAREVLPNSLKTEIVVTANLAEWKHIFNHRCSGAAHPQIRDLLLPLLEEMNQKYPGVFNEPAKKYLRLSDPAAS